MKILVTPERGVVSSLFVRSGPQSLDVLVNTTERWMQFHRQGGSTLIAGDPETGLVPEHQQFLIGFDAAESDLSLQPGFTLVAETPEEAQMLSWPCFALQDKDQINFLFQKHQNLSQVAAWKARSISLDGSAPVDL